MGDRTVSMCTTVVCRGIMETISHIKFRENALLKEGGMERPHTLFCFAIIYNQGNVHLPNNHGDGQCK